jgi:hypothetical protein
MCTPVHMMCIVVHIMLGRNGLGKEGAGHD